MSKFKIGDPVRVTSHKHKYFDQVGVIVAINEGPMTVKFADGKHDWLGEHNLTLADPDVHEVLAEMAEQSGLAADEKPRKDMAEMEIDGEYVRGGSVDHAATLKTMAQGLAAEMDAAQNAHRETVTHPPHYCSHPSGIETITITRHESFLRGNVLKYVLRAPYKGSEIEDLKKAAQYLQWEIDRAEAGQ